MKVGGNREWGLGKILKKAVGNIGGFHKIRGLKPLANYELRSCSGKIMFWYSRENPWKDLSRGSFSIKLQAKTLLHYRKWAQSQLFLKDFAWNFQNAFFAEHISVAAFWNHIIVRTVKQRYSKALKYVLTCFYHVRH